MFGCCPFIYYYNHLIIIFKCRLVGFHFCQLHRDFSYTCTLARNGKIIHGNFQECPKLKYLLPILKCILSLCLPHFYVAKTRLQNFQHQFVISNMSKMIINLTSTDIMIVSCIIFTYMIYFFEKCMYNIYIRKK